MSTEQKEQITSAELEKLGAIREDTVAPMFDWEAELSELEPTEELIENYEAVKAELISKHDALRSDRDEQNEA
jgi:hypothetical protein